MAPRKKEFDKAALDKLGSPFSVYVHQDVGGRQTPVDLPPVRPGELPGKGYTADDVESLAQVIPEIAGGGVFRCKAVDDGGRTVEWEWWWDPIANPRKTAPAVTHAAAPSTPIPPAALPPAAPPAPSSPAFAHWHLQRQQQHAQVQATGAPLPPYGGPPSLNVPTVGGGVSPFGTFGAPPAPPDPFEHPLWKERLARIELQNETKIRDARSADERQISDLARRVEQLSQQLSQKPAGPDAETKAALEQLKQRAEDAERRAAEAQQRADADARERRWEAQRREDRDATERMIQAIREEIKARPNGPDPTMQMFISSQERQAQMMQTSIDRLADAAKEKMSPMDLVNVFNQLNQSSGAGPLLQSITTSYSGMMQMFRSMVEMQAQLQPAGVHPAFEIGQQALEKVGNGIQSWIQYKAGQEEMNLRREVTKAQVDVQKAWAGQSAQPAQPAPDPEAVQPGAAAAEAPAGEEDDVERRVFGVAYEAIMRLRRGVMTGQLSPEQSAVAIIRGAEHFRGQSVPVFRYYEDRNYPPFVETLLPEAPPDYRREVVGHLNNLRGQVETAPPPEAAPEPPN